MSCLSRVLRNREQIFTCLLGKRVKVEAFGYVVEGVLKNVEVSQHDGFGNMILETKEGLVLVRGSASEVEKRG